ncbi:hypothetical protein PM082_009230 [Marasmius tenuissimus]|nr:hypothetical protein PM082_009230 [Marasmius tenuissimus]
MILVPGQILRERLYSCRSWLNTRYTPMEFTPEYLQPRLLLGFLLLRSRFDGVLVQGWIVMLVLILYVLPSIRRGRPRFIATPDVG